MKSMFILQDPFQVANSNRQGTASPNAQLTCHENSAVERAGFDRKPAR